MATGRRRLLRAAGGAAAAAVLAPVGGGRGARAAPPGLRIARWSHAIPAFDEWFERGFAVPWGEKQGVAVTVDHLWPGDLRARAAGEVAAQEGHDLFGFPVPVPALERHTVPLDDVVAECERRFGKLLPAAHRGTYNPQTRSYFALCDSWAPAPLHVRSDWWGEAGVQPDTWERLREGARRIQERRGTFAGFGLAPEPDSNGLLRGLLWSYGATEQDETGRVTLHSRGAVEAVKLMTALFRESMVPDAFAWDVSSNNRAYVWGRASIIQNPITALLAAEQQNPDVARRTALAGPAAGPAGRLAAVGLLHTFVVWRFSPRAELAKRFLVDLVAASGEAFRTSRAVNLPAFPRAVPDLPKRLAGDRRPGSRLTLLAEADRWSACPGHPGYLTPAIDECWTRGVIPEMFARAARGEASAEEAVRQADAEMKHVFARWQR